MVAEEEEEEEEEEEALRQTQRIVRHSNLSKKAHLLRMDLSKYFLISDFSKVKG